jgi:hypothetical protein
MTMDVDLTKNLSVDMDLTALGEAAKQSMLADGLPTDPCKHLIYQPMSYCADCQAHIDGVTKAMADRIDAQAVEAVYGAMYGRR